MEGEPLLIKYMCVYKFTNMYETLMGVYYKLITTVESYYIRIFFLFFLKIFNLFTYSFILEKESVRE